MDARARQLFEDHQDIPERAARAAWSRHGAMNGMTLEDYHQCAQLGLVKAATKWRPSRGTPFREYARCACANAIKDNLRTCDHAKRGARDDGLVPPTLSLDYPVVTNDAGRTAVLGDLLESPLAVDRDAAYDGLRLILGHLQPISRAIVYLIDVHGMTAEQADAVLGMGVGELNRRHRLARGLLESRMTFLAKAASAPKRGRGQRILKALAAVAPAPDHMLITRSPVE